MHYDNHMGDEAALRLLDLVRQKLDAVDARIEIGGSPPNGRQTVSIALNPHRRVVAVFGGDPPADAASRLAALVDAFAASADAPQSDGLAALSRRTLPTEIDAELNGLSVRAKAVFAVLIDASSPVVWGRSHPDLPEEIDAMLAVADAVGDGDPAELSNEPARWPTVLREHAGKDHESGRRLLMAALGVGAARDVAEEEPTAVGSMHKTVRVGSYTFMIRSLGGVYLLIIGFEGGFSEPQAEGVLQRGHSEIERLIVKLPPTDPPPRPGRVVSLRKNDGD